MPKKAERQNRALSSTEVRRTAKASSYGVSQETVTRNTGLILTDYMMKQAFSSLTKLKEEAEQPKKSEEEKRKEEAQKALDDVFELYSKNHEEYSSFGFVNEVNGLASSTDSPFLSQSSLPDSSPSTGQNSARSSSGTVSPTQGLG